jgi:transcriptional regulator with XRE-family HTH domain
MPSKRRTTSKAREGLGQQLQRAIEGSGRSAYDLSRAADVDPGGLSRFLSGQADLKLDTAARLADVLGLRLVDDGRRRRGGGRNHVRGIGSRGQVGEPIPGDPTEDGI